MGLSPTDRQILSEAVEVLASECVLNVDRESNLIKQAINYRESNRKMQTAYKNLLILIARLNAEDLNTLQILANDKIKEIMQSPNLDLPIQSSLTDKPEEPPK